MPSSGRPTLSVQPRLTNGRKPVRQLNYYEAQTRVTREEIGEWNMFFPSLVIDDDRDSVSGLKLLYCTYIRCQAEDKTVAGKIGEISVRFELNPPTPPPPPRVTTFFIRSIKYGSCTSSSFTQLPLFGWGRASQLLIHSSEWANSDMGESSFVNFRIRWRHCPSCLTQWPLL